MAISEANKVRGRCTKCGKTKSHLMFRTPRADRPGDLARGFSMPCKACHAAGMRRWNKTPRGAALVRRSYVNWKQMHPAYASERGRRRYATDPKYRAMLRLSEHTRRSREKGKVTPAQLERLFAKHAGVCFYCPERATSVDHKIPLARGGKHHIRNLVPACRSCNSRKNTKTVREFIASKEAA